MARGNQRDDARAKNLKKKMAEQKGNQREGDPLSRNADDKAALANKVAMKAERLAAQQAKADEDEKRASAAKRKAKKKDDAGLDDLLSAGLTGGKKKK